MKNSKRMTRFFKTGLVMVMALVFILGLSACGKKKQNKDGWPDFVETEDVTNYIEFTMDDGVVFIAELDPEAAPITVQNFQKLVGEKFYDGLTFHRIVEGFVAQGGDPQGDGMGGPGYAIVGEFNANGHPNPILHKKGTLSMARSQDYDSAGSQFFICLDDNSASHLDGEYAAFGHVIYGMDIVEDFSKDYLKAKDKSKVPTMKTVRFVMEAAPTK